MQLNDKIKLRATASHPTRSLGDVYEVSAIQAASDTFQQHAVFHDDVQELPQKRRYKRRDMKAQD